MKHFIMIWLCACTLNTEPGGAPPTPGADVSVGGSVSVAPAALAANKPVGCGETSWTGQSIVDLFDSRRDNNAAVGKFDTFFGSDNNFVSAQLPPAPYTEHRMSTYFAMAGNGTKCVLVGFKIQLYCYNNITNAFTNTQVLQTLAPAWYAPLDGRFQSFFDNAVGRCVSGTHAGHLRHTATITAAAPYQKP